MALELDLHLLKKHCRGDIISKLNAKYIMEWKLLNLEI